MQKSKVENNTAHYIIGIGASAGGLEAYNDFFDNAGENKLLSYILVQHLSPDHKSLLVDLLSKHTTMRVFEAENHMPIEANCIYVIPPKKHLTVEPGRLVITDKEEGDKGPNTAIDTFFYSLAEVYKERAIAVVLSGTGTDGSRGIQAIKDNDGLVIVQEPKLSKFDGMPRSSISTGLADLVLPTKAMYGEIEHYVAHVPEFDIQQKNINEETLSNILKTLNRQTGCDFNEYKTPTILRRLLKRMGFLKIENEQEYLNYLHENPEEGKIFTRDLLIGVTRFFRDPEAFMRLREKVLKPIINAKQDHEIIKIWVTACSTGEEVYTIAMILHDLLHEMDRHLEVKIFGTDLELTHIERASKAEYSSLISKEVPPEFLKRYFIQRDNSFVIIPELRKQIVFARHNVITDPPFIKNDLVSCRNMLIYMNPKLQRTVLSKFYFGLQDHGFLFLGSSESIVGNDSLFRELDRKWKLFSKIASARKAYHMQSEDRSAFSNTLRKRIRGREAAEKMPSLQEVVNSTMHEDFDIVGFAVDKNYIIQETSGNYRQYLSLPDDGIKLNLLKMLPDIVSIPLNTAIIKCSKDEAPVHLKNLQYTFNNRHIHLAISVRPDRLAQGLVLVVFNSVWHPMLAKEEDDVPVQPSNEVISRLKKDLRETRFNLQTTIEELETTNEELQSSNEELLSSNEELQSSNEELQSLNEELHTLNAEHQLKIQELMDLTDDLNNYFRCSDIGQVIVDCNMLIRKFNPAAAKFINFADTDVLRSISHFSRNFNYERFEQDINEVLHEDKVIEREIALEDGTTILVRIYSYIRNDNAIDGALISFIDISTYKKLNSIINGVFDSSKNAIIALAAVRNPRRQVIDFETITANAVASRLFGRDLAAEKILFSEVSRQLYKHIFEPLVEVFNNGNLFSTEIGLDGKWFDVSAVRMSDGVALTLNDISERKQVEDQLRRSYSDLIVAKEKLKTLNMELEQRVADRTRELAQSEERFRLISGVTNDVLVDWNFIDNSIWLSSNFNRLFGYNIEQSHIDRNFWLSKIHPQDRQRVIDTMSNNINNAVVSWELEYRYENANGNYHLITDRSFLMTDDRGMPYRLLSSMLDITNLRQVQDDLRNSEVQLDIALEMALMAGWSKSLADNKILYSPMLLRIFDIEPQGQQQPPLQQFAERIHPDDMPLVDAAYRACLISGLYEYEARVIWRDGSIHWVRVTGKLITDSNGNPQQLIGITRDMTDEKNASLRLENMVRQRTTDLNVANEQLTLTNKQLSQTNAELEQFAYIASHDLQEPLRKIQTFISMIGANRGSEQFVSNYLAKINSSALRMSALIKNVLEYSRLSKKDLDFEKVDLDKVLRDLLTDLELAISEKQASVQVEHLPVIPGIPHQLSQLFLNLLSNALKFSKKKPVVHIWAQQLEAADYRRFGNLDAQKEYVLIKVKDNGIGFDQAYAEDIFRFFYRLEGENGADGSGIGLALCKKIVENHDGFISASSQPGVGTEFSIVLPLQLQAPARRKKLERAEK